MSPLAIVILKVLRWGVLGVAGFLAAVLVIEAAKHGWDVRAVNPGFAGVVALLIAGSLWLSRSIARELARHGA